MTEYKFENATVRIHGEIERERVEQSTIIYLKKVIKCRKEKSKTQS